VTVQPQPSPVRRRGHCGKRPSWQRPHTTPRIRAELKAAQSPARLLASQYGHNAKTVLKWRGRSETTDAPMEPKPKSAVLMPAEEPIIEVRRRTLLRWMTCSAV
jgi:hypothetical protein